MARRTTELWLLLGAVPVVILLFIMAIINDGQALDFSTLAVPLGLVCAFIISHIAVRIFAPNADPALLPLAFVLSGIGIAFVMRLAPSLAGRQVVWLFCGISAMIVTLAVVRSIKKLTDYKYIIMLLGIILLLLPAFAGVEKYGSKIWLEFAGFSFQPGELAKVLIVLFLAGYLAENREMLSVSKRRVLGIAFPDLRTLAPLLLMWAISMFIVVFERDLGSALLFFFIFIVMVYVATGRLFYVILGVLLAIVGCIAAYFLFSHVQNRVAIWLNPFADAQNAGYQLVQAIYSLADGGLIGTGVGRGMPDLIPVVASDFIFVAIAEEMGLFGAAGVLICYVLFAVRGLSIAARARSDIDAFTAAGLTASILLQAFVIVGGVTQLIPLTGVTLPFMSQGGSSLLASFIIVGLLLRAGDSSTGLATELVSAPTLDGGVLGRLALGKRLTVLITVFACLFALLIANLTWHMVVQAGSVQAMAANNHTIAREQGAQRGAIYTADGVVLAQSVESADGSYLRDYPEGSLAAHVIGYSSVQYGSSGIEATQQQVLRGESGFTSWSDAINAAAGRQIPGNDVQLTIDSRLQKAAESALQGQTGAAVILDAQTGAVLGMASSPAYDVNDVAALLDSNDASGNSELYNRATQALYAPGSTFKIVTLAGGLDSAGLTLDSRFDAPGTMDIGNAPVTNFNRTDYGELSLLQGFEHSSNTVFAQVADRMGPRNLVNTADRFGFDRLFGRDFTVARSLMPNPDEMTEWETAWAGAGMPVGEHESAAGPQATVIQMALVSAAIANDGVIMNPYLTARVTSPNGTVIQTTQPEVFESQAASPATIASIREAMAGVVQSGTGTSAQVPGYTVRGKTGTAETGKAADDSWFSGYIEVGDRRIVVALVLEQAGSGAATPKAGGLFEAAVAVYAG